MIFCIMDWSVGCHKTLCFQAVMKKVHMALSRASTFMDHGKAVADVKPNNSFISGPKLNAASPPHLPHFVILKVCSVDYCKYDLAI